VEPILCVHNIENQSHSHETIRENDACCKNKKRTISCSMAMGSTRTVAGGRAKDLRTHDMAEEIAYGAQLKFDLLGAREALQGLFSCRHLLATSEVLQHAARHSGASAHCP